MLIPPEVKKCVIFISYNTNEGEQLAGTGFFVSAALKEFSDQSLNYLVTAKHVIEGIKKNSSDQKVFLRVNLVSGSSKVVESKVNQWKYHTDKSVDAAVVQWSPSQTEYDYLGIGSKDMVVTEDIIKDEQIGIGDEVFLTGLFYKHKGKDKNLPIVRVGNIAMMPEEKVWVGNGFDYVDAYLVESRSIGGLSGSPVFVHMGNLRPKNGTINLGGGGQKIMYWLGLMHGHWNMDKNHVDSAIFDTSTNEKLNSGISIVVPASKIMEIINNDEFTKQREELEKKFKEKQVSTLD